MHRETQVRDLYAALACLLNVLEELDENIDTTKITGGGSLGVMWERENDRWRVWDQEME